MNIGTKANRRWLQRNQYSWSAEELNQITEEMQTVIRLAGLTPNEQDTTQLSQAIPILSNMGSLSLKRISIPVGGTFDINSITAFGTYSIHKPANATVLNAPAAYTYTDPDNIYVVHEKDNVTLDTLGNPSRYFFRSQNFNSYVVYSKSISAAALTNAWSVWKPDLRWMEAPYYYSFNEWRPPHSSGTNDIVCRGDIQQIVQNVFIMNVQFRRSGTALSNNYDWLTAAAIQAQFGITVQAAEYRTGFWFFVGNQISAVSGNMGTHWHWNGARFMPSRQYGTGQTYGAFPTSICGNPDEQSALVGQIIIRGTRS